MSPRLISLRIALVLVGQVLMEVVGTFGIPGVDIQFVPAQFLQVGGLSLHEEFIDGGNRYCLEQPHVYSHANLAQVMHGLFAADLFGRTKNAQGSTDMIVQIVPAFLDEKFTSFSFVFDQSRDDFADSFENLLFALAESHLVADLIQVTHELGTFAEQSTHGHIDFGERAEHFIDLLGRDQCRQMEHHADAQAGTYIGGASGQVAQLFCECVGQFALERIVEIVHSLPCGLQVETALHDLQPKVILFVDHDTEAFLGVEDHRTRPFGFA